MPCNIIAGAGWGYFILNLFLLLAVADATVAALAALFTMRSHNWRTAGTLHSLRLAISCTVNHVPCCQPLPPPSNFPSQPKLHFFWDAAVKFATRKGLAGNSAASYSTRRLSHRLSFHGYLSVAN